MPKIAEKVVFDFQMEWLTCSDGGYSPLALPRLHPCSGGRWATKSFELPHYEYEAGCLFIFTCKEASLQTY